MTISDFLIQLTEHCGLSADQAVVSVDENDEEVLVHLNIPEEESGLFIGHRGETLGSLQRLLRLAFLKDFPDKRVVLNINQYRENRTEKLVDMAQSAARKVLETGHNHTFIHYLPANERFIIHSTISSDPEFERLESISVGEGRERKLIVRLKQ